MLKSRSALVLISHDRRFLEKVSTAVVWLDRGLSRVWIAALPISKPGVDEVLEAEELEQHKGAGRSRREEHWLRYGVTARRTSAICAVWANCRAFVPNIAAIAGRRAPFRHRNGRQGKRKLVIEAEAITKRYEDRQIVAPFSIRVIVAIASVLSARTVRVRRRF